MRPAPARACSERRRPPSRTGRKKRSSCARGGRRKFCIPHLSCSAREVGSSTPPARSPRRKNEGSVSEFLHTQSGFFDRSGRRAVVLTREAGLDRAPCAGVRENVPSLAAQAPWRGALLRSAAQSGRRRGREAPTGTCRKASKRAGGFLPGNVCGHTGGKAHLIWPDRLSRAKRASESQGAACSARGSGARRGVRKNRLEPAHAWALRKKAFRTL